MEVPRFMDTRHGFQPISYCQNAARTTKSKTQHLTFLVEMSE